MNKDYTTVEIDIYNNSDDIHLFFCPICKQGVYQFRGEVRSENPVLYYPVEKSVTIISCPKCRMKYNFIRNYIDENKPIVMTSFIWLNFVDNSEYINQRYSCPSCRNSIIEYKNDSIYTVNGYKAIKPPVKIPCSNNICHRIYKFMGFVYPLTLGVDFAV